ncbi:RraA family protein [Breoghania sp. JC706]|uniref:RraA family protein n=1 Tax=Breoghania sp. JC706 TaxID=3117732 RepID=UPI003008FC46
MTPATLSNPEHDPLLAAAKALDTASLSDALDSLGLPAGLAGIRPQTGGARCAGYAYTVLYEPVETEAGGGGFRNAADYIDDVPAGAVIVSSNPGRTDCTTWGDILTQMAALKGIAGTVIDGAARDIETVRALGYPLFSRAVFMRSGKNRVQLRATQVPVAIDGTIVAPGDLVVGDANGCVVVPRGQAREVLRRAAAVEATENRILAAIRSGVSLAQARKLNRYDQPWIVPSASQN